MRLRLRHFLLLASGGLCAVAPVLPLHGVDASVPSGGGVTVLLDDPSPLLAYDTHGLLDEAAPVPALPRVVVAHVDEQDLECLSTAVYFEARSEPAEGQRAVAQVVLNRVGRRGYPGSVCGVVYQGAQGGRGCQFKFVCDGSMAARREQGAWATARRIARAVIDGDILASLRGATFFHTRASRPDWSARMVRVATIGSHIFYRSAHA
jgi:spore germination cell wall hydrolase CwlJ-like protein